MFATLLGTLPDPPRHADMSIEARIESIVRAQEAAGLDPVTDGGHGGDTEPIASWRRTASLTDRTVKSVITGPYTVGAGVAGTASTASDRATATLACATAANVVIRDLADAGCRVIEIHEPAAVTIGTDAAERALFRKAHERLLAAVDGIHVSLAITGGSADAAGIETILGAPFASLAVDLIAGPDNWRLVAVAPRTVGIICGALSPMAGADDGPETLLWAAGYAASTRGRGPSRVGLATASSLTHLPWSIAVRKLERLGEAARIADLPAEERAKAIDPRAVSSRSAALGRVEARPSRGPDRDDDPT
jgi:methionine synthase II (cobalamin-independent)